MKKYYILLVILVVLGLFSQVSAVSAAKPSDLGLKDGDMISAVFSTDPDVYIVNESGFKRLFLNPTIFSFYGQLTGGFASVKVVTPQIRDAFPTSGLFRDCESNDQKVYGIQVEGEDKGQLRWVNESGDQAVKDDPQFFQKVFCINNKEFQWYPKGNVFNSVKDIPEYSRNIGITPVSTPSVTPTLTFTPSPRITQAKTELTSTTITSCGEITQSGNYILGADLSAPSYVSCLNIHDVSNVRLNCASHSISLDIATHPDFPNDANIYLKNVNDFSIDSCNLKTLNNKSNQYLAPLKIYSSHRGEVSNNIFGFNGVYVAAASSDIKFSNNTFNSGFWSDHSSNITLQSNNFKLPTAPTAPAAVVYLSWDNGDVISGNTIDGSWDNDVSHVGNTGVGSDDGVLLQVVDNVTVENNIIKNNWDCGIETSGLITNTTISGNNISKIYNCAIGAWYLNSWRNNTISDNSVTDVMRMFYIYRTFGLQPYETKVYFENNSFTNNKLISVKNNNGFSSSRFYFNGLPGLTLDDIVAKNNTFTNNDFSAEPLFPFIYHVSLAVDGGGNKCGGAAPQSDFPLYCPNVITTNFCEYPAPPDGCSWQGGSPYPVCGAKLVCSTPTPTPVTPVPITPTPTLTPTPNPTQTIPLSSYDYNNDGIINDNDVIILLRAVVNIAPCPINKICDINGDGAVNNLDLIYLSNIKTKSVITPTPMPQILGISISSHNNFLASILDFLRF